MWRETYTFLCKPVNKEVPRDECTGIIRISVTNEAKEGIRDET